MDTKKGLDLAAGRLARIPGPSGKPRAGRPKAAGSYGTERLGITAKADPPAAEAPLPPPAPREKGLTPAPSPPQPARWRDRLGDLRALGKYARRPWVWAVALGTVAAVTLACFLPGGADEGTTPLRAVAQVRRPSPAAAASTNEPAARQAAADADDGRAENQPAPPGAAASSPAQRSPGADPVTEGVSSFLRWVGAAGARAARQRRAAERIDVEAPDAAARSQRSPAAPAAGGEDASTAKGQAPPAPAAVQYGPCPPGFRFTGAIRQPTGVFANINGRFVRVGGTVSGAKVIKIGRSSVEMERDGRRFIVGFGTGPRRRVEPDEADAAERDANEPPAPEEDANTPAKKPD
jgi:hypothetical protein